jgi:RimJ/RimL family protein N-acetyltransferase
MIRDAQLADLERILEMGQHFRKGTPYEKYITDSPECRSRLATQLIERKSLLVSEHDGKIVGMIGFLIYPHFMSGEIFAGELFWWVEPEHRGQGLRLEREMKKRARLAGAIKAQMIAPNKKVARVIQRIGYEFVEATYQINL